VRGILGTIRASSWSTLFDCQHRWYWKNIYGLKSPSSGKAMVGTAVHAGTAYYDQHVIEGTANVLTSTHAIDAAREKIADPEQDVQWDDDMNKSMADHYAKGLTAKYIWDVAPKVKYRAVEVLCNALDVETEHGTLRLTGTTDRIRDFGEGRLGIADVKTGGAATARGPAREILAATKGHGAQLGVYTLMAEHESGSRLEGPATIIGLQTTAQMPSGIGEIKDVRTPLIGTEDAPGMITIAAKILKEGMFAPNPSSKLCSAKYCAAHAQGRCKYHD
jgi:PD-(D/E)XK nuclease superfamily